MVDPWLVKGIVKFHMEDEIFKGQVVVLNRFGFINNYKSFLDQLIDVNYLRLLNFIDFVKFINLKRFINFVRKTNYLIYFIIISCFIDKT